MLRKIIITFLMAFFVLAISGPVTGHDGSRYILNNDPGGDEHPWGDENYSIDRPIIGSGEIDITTISIFPTITISIHYSFLRLAKFYTDYTSLPEDRPGIDTIENNMPNRNNTITKLER